ncbi:unnamed protein product [Moneuplotes crassus]|uniref:PPM-type phosphatase domain-containing protein n=1 Tax=Euplotes crassus TaxID=5936 RepID=A0AAD1Y8G7_EUPCR|nr:unnamed protein product [Moneuplotes crassus]
MRIKDKIHAQTKNVNLQKVLNRYKCITKENPRQSTGRGMSLDHLKNFKSIRNKERANIISRELSNITSNKARKSLEPLQLDKEEFSPETSSPLGGRLTFAKMTRTGYIPVLPETGFKKKQNQDSSIILQNFLGITNNYFLGVFDGHGTNGAKVSGFIKNAIPEEIKRAYEELTSPVGTDINSNFKTMTAGFINKDKNPARLDTYQNLRFRTKIIEQSIDNAQKKLKNRAIDIKFSGSTANICLVGPDHVLTCANVGDSRSILIKCHNEGTKQEVWTCKALSRDHKPDLSDEKSRIESNGGRVACFRDSNKKNIGPPRVWLKRAQIPGLAMSRSFGDEVACCAGVTHKPEIQHCPLTQEDKAVVLASDGVWEFLSNKQVTNILTNYIKAHKPRKGCEKVVSESVRLWKLRDSVIDDITIIVAILPSSQDTGIRGKGVYSSLSCNRLPSC